MYFTELLSSRTVVRDFFEQQMVCPVLLKDFSLILEMTDDIESKETSFFKNIP